ncbi:MAG: hypothetical protein RSD96_03020 [Bacilli bacterium]
MRAGYDLSYNKRAVVSKNNSIDIRKDNAIIEASKIYLAYPKMDENIYNLLVNYYTNFNDKLPEITLPYLFNELSVYFKSYDSIIDIINANPSIIFMKPPLLEAKLACLHLIHVDKDALENCVSLIIKSKIKDLYSVCSALNLAKQNDNIEPVDARKVLAIIARVSEENKTQEYNNSFSTDDNAFKMMIIEYKRFVMDRKESVSLSLEVKE